MTTRLTMTTLLTATLLASCGDIDLARPMQADAALESRAGGGACLAKKTLSDRVTFASADRAGKNLGRPDHWALQLSAFDRGARLRTLEPTKWQELLHFASQQGVDWASADEAYWGALADRLSDALAGLNLKVPHTRVRRPERRAQENARPSIEVRAPSMEPAGVEPVAAT